jgi:hypothetical protein
MKLRTKDKRIKEALPAPPEQPKPKNDLTPYRFQPGTIANPTGENGHGRGYAIELSRKIMRSHPPKALCEEIAVDPSVTWGEAIMFALSSAAARGDVSAAREVLAALGFSGTASKNLFAIQNNAGEMTGVAGDFLKHSHGLSDAQITEVFAFMDSLPRAAIQIDATYFPPAEEEQ